MEADVALWLLLEVGIYTPVRVGQPSLVLNNGSNVQYCDISKVFRRLSTAPLLSTVLPPAQPLFSVMH